jgi:hypothetical protein
MQCGRHTHSCFEILDTLLLHLELLEPQLEEFLSKLCWSPGRGVGQPKGLWCREGGTIPLVVQVEGNEILLVGIDVGVNKI